MDSDYEGFEFVMPIPEDYYEEVIVHLRNNFFADEPLNKSLNLVSEPGDPHLELEKVTLSTLKDNLSIMVLDKETNKVIAVVLSGVLHEGDLETAQEKLSKINDEKFKTIFGFLYRISQSLDLFKKYDVTEIFECKILSVDKKYRAKGFGGRLLKMSEDVARSEGFKIWKGDGTSAFSQRILIKNGFETIFELKYEDHRDEEGKVIFKTEPPHDGLKILIKLL